MFLSWCPSWCCLCRSCTRRTWRPAQTPSSPPTRSGDAAIIGKCFLTLDALPLLRHWSRFTHFVDAVGYEFTKIINHNQEAETISKLTVRPFTIVAQLFFTSKNSYFVNDEVWSGCPQSLGMITYWFKSAEDPEYLDPSEVLESRFFQYRQVTK